MERKAYQEIRQGYDLPNDKPLNSISNKTHKSSYKENDGQGQIHQGQPGGPAEHLPHIRSHSEIIELDLRNPKHGFQGRRVGREIEVGSRECLNPNRCHQNHPLAGLPGHRGGFGYERRPRRSIAAVISEGSPAIARFAFIKKVPTGPHL